MTPIDVRLGTLGDVYDAASVYECSNLARRQGSWPSRAARVAQVTASLHDTAGHDTSWFLIGRDGTEAVAMALVHPFRADGGRGDVIAGTWFLSLIYVVPERWGEGIGGRLLDAMLAEAKRRGCHHMYLWTHEHQNERAQRLYRSRSFAPTRRTMHDGEGQRIGEWRFVCEQP
jgi:GNAT superfamily N-acetyltransferase